MLRKLTPKDILSSINEYKNKINNINVSERFADVYDKSTANSLKEIK